MDRLTCGDVSIGVVTSSEQSQLLVAAEWIAEHRELVVRIANTFLSTGGWPTRQDLGRAAMREGSSDDVFELLKRIPPPVGWLDTQDRVRLRVRGLAVSPNADSVLREFTRVLRLAELRLLSDEPEPTVTSDDLTSPSLGLSEEQARLVGELILGEDWMFNGGSGDTTGRWERFVNERTRFIAGLNGIDDYLRAEGALLWSGPARASSFFPERDATSPLEVIRLDALHPLIVDAAAEPFASEDYPRAVQAAWFALRDLVRQRIDAHQLDGTELMERIGKTQPVLALTPYVTESDRSMHQGLWHYLVGTASFVRNPEMHETVSPVRHDRVGAFERLAVMSLCARFVEASASPLAVEQAVTEASQAGFSATDAAADDLVHSIPTAQRPRLVDALVDSVFAARKAQEPQRARNLRAVYRRALRRLAADDPSISTARRRVSRLIADDETFPIGIDLLMPLVLETMDVRYREKVGRAFARTIDPEGLQTSSLPAVHIDDLTAELFPVLSMTARREVLDAVVSALEKDVHLQTQATRIAIEVAADLTNEEGMRLAVAVAQAIIHDAPHAMARELEPSLAGLPEVLRRQLQAQLLLAYKDAPGRNMADELLAQLRRL